MLLILITPPVCVENVETSIAANNNDGVVVIGEFGFSLKLSNSD